MTTRSAFLAGLAYSCGMLSGPSPARADTPLIRIGAGLDDESTALIYAAQTGMFQRAGLNVQVQRFNSGSVIVAAVAGGAIEVGKVNTMAAITAYARGLPMKLIAPAGGWNSEAPIRGIIVATNSRVHAASDLNGATIGISSLGDIDMYSAQAWMDQNGGDSKTVKFVEIPQPAVAVAIDQGRITGGFVGEPLLSTALDTKKYRLAAACNDAIGKRWEIAVVTAREDWIESTGASVERFVRVIHDANVYVGAHESAAAPLIMQFLGIDPTAARNAKHPIRSPYLTAAAIQPPIDMAARYNLIPKPFPATDIISSVALRPPAR
jgi:NitT/TauT family transport system substrate-binding protein